MRLISEFMALPLTRISAMTVYGPAGNLHLQPGGARSERRFGFAARQLRIGLQREQHMLARPSTVAVHPLSNLGQSLLSFARAPSAQPFAQRANA
jgi:hypothetical protein